MNNKVQKIIAQSIIAADGNSQWLKTLAENINPSSKKFKPGQIIQSKYAETKYTFVSFEEFIEKYFGAYTLIDIILKASVFVKYTTLDRVATYTWGMNENDYKPYAPVSKFKIGQKVKVNYNNGVGLPFIVVDKSKFMEVYPNLTMEKLQDMAGDDAVIFIERIGHEGLKEVFWERESKLELLDEDPTANLQKQQELSEILSNSLSKITLLL